MDPALAQRYGPPYVHLAAVAIDLDRIAHALTETQECYGAEVYLTALYLKRHFSPEITRDCALIEDTCLSVMEREGEIMGGQLPFSVHALVKAGSWENAWPVIFSAWKNPRQLMDRYSEFWNDDAAAGQMAKRFLDCAVSPPIIEITVQFLQDLSSAKTLP